MSHTASPHPTYSPFAKIGLRVFSKPCKICGGKSRYAGTEDFSKSCLENEGIVRPTVGIPVVYLRCGECKFLFTDHFDQWSNDDFAREVYNDKYVEVDPDFVELRSKNNAEFIGLAFEGAKKTIQILDYGSGNGQLATRLNDAGFSAQSYDPYFSGSQKPTQTFDLITCFEVMEHTPFPKQTLDTMLSFLKKDGIILFSTMAADAEAQKLGTAWWYVGPRNGHISIYSAKALDILFGERGYKVASQNINYHVALKSVPAYAAHLFG